jgi:hypothetical protein
MRSGSEFGQADSPIGWLRNTPQQPPWLRWSRTSCREIHGLLQKPGGRNRRLRSHTDSSAQRHNWPLFRTCPVHRVIDLPAEHLDQISRGIDHRHLRSSWSGDDFVAELDPIGAQARGIAKRRSAIQTRTLRRTQPNDRRVGATEPAKAFASTAAAQSVLHLSWDGKPPNDSLAFHGKGAPVKRPFELSSKIRHSAGSNRANVPALPCFRANC